MENFEQSPIENLIDDESKKIVITIASYFCLARKLLLNYVQFLSWVHRDLDLKDLLKDSLMITSDYELIRTLLYMTFKGEPLKPKSLYRVFKKQ